MSALRCVRWQQRQRMRLRTGGTERGLKMLLRPYILIRQVYKQPSIHRLHPLYYRAIRWMQPPILPIDSILGVTTEMQPVAQTDSALARLRDDILAAVPSKRIKDLLNYLHQYRLPPSCTTTLARCFTRTPHTLSQQLRNNYEALTYHQRTHFYTKLLHACNSILIPQTPFPTSYTHLDPPLLNETVEALIRDASSAGRSKEAVVIDYEGLKIVRGGSSLALQDYMMTSEQYHYIKRVRLLPLAARLPQLQIDCPSQLCQRLEEASSRATQVWLMGMMERSNSGPLDSQDQEEAQSDRASIVQRLPQVKGEVEQAITCNAQGSEYLLCRHPQKATREDCRRLLPKGKGHYFFEGEFCQGKEGELVVSNEDKLQAQSSVIKYILKRLISGGKVTSISLPVTVFGTDSNLSLLMGSFRHAPLILAGAVQLQPLERFKRVVKFALSCPPCYIRCDKPFNPILGETYQRRVAGTLFYGQQVSHHPPISAAFIRAPDFTLYGSFEAEVEFGFNSAIGNNRGWTRISFHPSDIQQQVVRFTNSPGEMGGLIFGKRTLKLTGSVYFIDEQHLLFCQLFFGRVKLQPGVSAKQDSIQGRVVRLKPGTDLSRPQAISERDVGEVMGLVRGQWLSRAYFNEELLLDSLEEHPPIIDDYHGLLPSDYSLRQDINLKLTGDIDKCQAAKEALEEAQRRDRRLREERRG